MESWALPRPGGGKRRGQGKSRGRNKMTVCKQQLPHVTKSSLQRFHPVQSEPETRWLCGNDWTARANALPNCNIQSQDNTQVSDLTKDTVTTSSPTCDCHRRRLLGQEGKLNSLSFCICLPGVSILPHFFCYHGNQMQQAKLAQDWQSGETRCWQCSCREQHISLTAQGSAEEQQDRLLLPARSCSAPLPHPVL